MSTPPSLSSPPAGPAAAAATDEPFWRQPAPALLAAAGASLEGLTSAEAERRLTEFGRNVVQEPIRRRLIAKIVRRVAEPLIAILIVAALVSAALGDHASFVIIVAIIAISTTLDVSQEHRAEGVADALKRSVGVQARVRRDGALAGVPVEGVVPGDIVALRAGDLVPADGVVLEARGAHSDEAILTGEAFPVEKRPGVCASVLPADAFNALFGGTAMVAGEATMLVVATGARTRFGGIAAALEASQPPTAFERGLHGLGMLIVRMTTFLLLLVLLANLALGRPAMEAFLFAVALAIGLTPGLLPMVMTVTLSRGALRLARRKVIVKRLSAIHDLGAMDVLCADKTGTLTQARISLVAHVDAVGATSGRVLELATLNSRFESGIRSPLDDAILESGEAVDLTGWSAVADAPFDFERRRVSVLAAHGGDRLLVVKGAPETIIERATRVEQAGGGLAPLDAALRARLDAFQQEQAAQGLRCLGIAWRAMPADQASADAEDETDLTFAGFCVFVDPPKPSAAVAIARLERAGVRIKIISGDTAPVLRHIVEALGLKAHRLITGAEVETLTDVALAGRVAHVDLFARVTPEQKARIVRALRASGHTVGFIGDGINDAPAIKAADAGLSVDGASDVARAAADLILLEHDLGVIADGVIEGRRTYANIMKYVRMGTSSNFGNMISMALASLFLPFLPLTPVQVLLNDLLYDISETGVSFDAVDEQEIARPHDWSMPEVWRFALVMGPLSSVFDIATFLALTFVFDAPVETFRTAWFVESMATQLLVVFLIRTSLPFWTSRPHRVLVVTSLGALAVALGVAMTPLGRLVGFEPLPGAVLACIVGLVALYLACAEALKRVGFGPRHPTRRPHERTRLDAGRKQL
ncbi:magnesium-translocating P-type ATPase [Alsobacter sp. SYSU M60028]|uniref:Magnesium-transporting ATPase, P-type 1 n=1 Tax=Alsobacter ponti TaxID=2962936 RepID=A0ABT1LAY7_9HYPH|nr:magnesium-translocating P-type ATPase [Alsobacter ponti]MCP8938151.1 magnesium-translocating P-type ATPase [Alsobacter ponti]